MDLLEHFNNQQPKNSNFISRKYYLPQNANINLYGVRGAGKTSLVLDYIEEEEIELESTLYIDIDSPHFMFNSLNIIDLQKYIEQNSIKVLILDHYEQSTLPYFPNVEKLIVISRVKLNDTHLKAVELFPLDYEEFLAFETSHTQRGFNHFLRSGTLPVLAGGHKNNFQIMKTFFQSSFTSNEQKLLLILSQHNTKHLTTHQIYTFAKDNFKVSKDWLYKTIKEFSKEGLIYFIDDKYQKSGKKMILFDFAFAKFLTIGQPFIMQFDTMIALTLIKHHIKVETLGIHGYLTPKMELIIPAPFESEDSLWVKSQNKFALYKKHGITSVTIVTVTNSYEYNIEKLHFEAMPFDEWSILHNEENN